MDRYMMEEHVTYLDREEIRQALFRERADAFVNGHDWDVADVMAILDEWIDWED